MDKINTPKVSSYQTVINSIEDDYDTYQWFGYLLWQEQPKTLLCEAAGIDRLYSNLADKERNELLGRTVIFILVYVFIRTQMAYMALPVLPLCLGLFFLKKGKKEIIIKLSSLFLQQEFSQDIFGQKTLYQLAEIISKKYHTTSLVDVIFFNENFFRLFLIGIFLLFVSPFIFVNIFDNLLVIILFMFFIKSIVTSRWTYRHPKLMRLI